MIEFADNYCYTMELYYTNKPSIQIKLLVKLILMFSWTTYVAQDQFVLQSELIPANDTVWVYKPSCYSSSASLPALYLLHGLGGNYQQWNNIISIKWETF